MKEYVEVDALAEEDVQVGMGPIVFGRVDVPDNCLGVTMKPDGRCNILSPGKHFLKIPAPFYLATNLDIVEELAINNRQCFDIDGVEFAFSVIIKYCMAGGVNYDDERSKHWFELIKKYLDVNPSQNEEEKRAFWSEQHPYTKIGALGGREKRKDLLGRWAAEELKCIGGYQLKVLLDASNYDTIKNVMIEYLIPTFLKYGLEIVSLDDFTVEVR